MLSAPADGLEIGHNISHQVRTHLYRHVKLVLQQAAR